MQAQHLQHTGVERRFSFAGSFWVGYFCGVLPAACFAVGYWLH